MRDNSHKSVNEEEISREGDGNGTVLRIEKYATKIFSQKKIMRIFVAALRSNETGKQI